MNKKEVLLLRLETDEKTSFRQAAALAGISLSAWSRERLRSAAIRELEDAGYQVPFVKRIPLLRKKEHG